MYLHTIKKIMFLRYTHRKHIQIHTKKYILITLYLSTIKHINKQTTN